MALGLGPKAFVGIYSVNCPEWVLTEQAAYTYSMVLVPLYDTLGPDATAFIIKEAEISVVVCEDDAKANMLLEKAPRCLKKIVTIKPVQPATMTRAKNRFVDILTLDDLERMGAAKDHPEVVRILLPALPASSLHDLYFESSLHNHGLVGAPPMLFFSPSHSLRQRTTCARCATRPARRETPRA